MPNLEPNKSCKESLEQTISKEETMEYWVFEATKGRNVAECWQNCNRIISQLLEKEREKRDEWWRFKITDLKRFNVDETDHYAPHPQWCWGYNQSNEENNANIDSLLEQTKLNQNKRE